MEHRFRQEFGDEIAEAIAESFEGDLDTLMNKIEDDDDKLEKGEDTVYESMD